MNQVEKLDSKVWYTIVLDNGMIVTGSYGKDGYSAAKETPSNNPKFNLLDNVKEIAEKVHGRIFKTTETTIIVTKREEI